MNYILTNSYEAMSKKAASLICAQILMKPVCVLGLATGSTPIGAYKQLAALFKAGEVSFKDVSTVNLDEYCGLEDAHPQSYRTYMNYNLFNHIDIEKHNTYVPDGMAENFTKECAKYDKTIHELGGIDLQLLGIGNNGHIGFNEPGEEFVMDTHRVLLSEDTISANSRFFENEISNVPTAALTMGLRGIMHARKVVLLACGKAKLEIIDRALYGPVTPKLPASILQLHPDLTVICAKEC